MPAGVWARSVSASEIEVNWQALSNSPERVLGYEVHFSLLNGNRNHTHTTWFKCLSAPLSFLWAITYSQNYTVLCSGTTGKHIRVFSAGTKGKTPVHMDLFVQLSAIGIARRRRSNRLYCSLGVAAQTVTVAVAGNDPVAVDKRHFRHKQIHVNVQIQFKKKIITWLKLNRQKWNYCSFSINCLLQ